MLIDAPRTPARAVALLGAGLLLGVSFIATPVKFGADVPLPQLVDIGRVTLRFFGWIEWGVVLALGIAAIRRPTPGLVAVIVALGVLLLVQQLGLRPVLDERVEQHLRGTPPAATWHHHVYVALEVVELALLLGLALVPGRGARAAAGPT